MSSEGGFEVLSADGTPIAVWVEGSGPPLVLVHGALSDHTTFALLIAELRDRMTTFTMDRRGRPASGDGTAEYSIEREFEDVAAVADEVATRTGQRVALWGHSYGADCAMGAAGLTKSVDHVVLYEPGFATEYPSDAVDAIDRAIAAGDNEGAILASSTPSLRRLSSCPVPKVLGSSRKRATWRWPPYPTLGSRCWVATGTSPIKPIQP